RRHGAVTYGQSESATFRVVGLRGGAAGSRFGLEREGEHLGQVELPVPGRHNALNAAGAAATALLLGVPFASVAAALARYAGVARRFQMRGSAGGVTYIDDYAHLPGEVRAALDAAGDGGWRRVVCVFQPHRYSRTAALWPDFADVFAGADLLVVTDVYGAGEEPRPGVSGKLIVQAVLDAHPFRAVAWLPRRAELVSYLRGVLRPGDVCLTLGAGDLTSVPGDLLAGAGGPR
ncbi:MAG: UDP-N-acetylmuramate--L-alanine ligase, partial [Actinobacteria bacterium]|nr:UDP-N-acetylmuramate--L-alanine ligase [Actinomycetota bacterium]